MMRYLFEWTDFGADPIESGSEFHDCKTIEQIQEVANDILESLKDGNVFVYPFKAIYYRDTDGGMILG